MDFGRASRGQWPAMAGKAGYRHRRNSSFIASCFTASTTSDDEADNSSSHLPPPAAKSPCKFPRFFSMPRLRDTKKTVPVDAPETPTAKGNISKSDSKSKQGNISNSGSKSKNRHRRHHSAAVTETCIEESPKKSSIIHISSKSDSHFLQSPLHHMRDSAHIETATSHPGIRKNRLYFESNTNSFVKKSYKQCEGTNKLDPDAGLLVLMVILTALLLFGRASAIVCMSAWFYLMPRKRVAATSMTSSKMGSPGFRDVGSEEIKRRVVLQGLLERDKRKLSRSVTAPIQTF